MASPSHWRVPSHRANSQAPLAMAQTVWNSFWEKITVNYLDRSPPKGGVSKIEFHSLIIHMFFPRGLKHDAPQRWMTSLATICLYILFICSSLAKSIDILIKNCPKFFETRLSYYGNGWMAKSVAPHVSDEAGDTC